MAATSRSHPPKKRIPKPTHNSSSLLFTWPKVIYKKLSKRRRDFLNRRPHQSFRLTRRRDYKRRLQLPGYWALTNQVRRLIWKNKWLFTKFIVVYALLSGLILGLMSQDTFQSLSQTIQDINTDALSGRVGSIGQNFVITIGLIGGVFSQPLSESQRVYGGLLFLLGWLSAIWLLRQIMAGHKNIRLRDSLYASAAPLLSTFLIMMLVIAQVLPFAIAIVGYVTASGLNVLSDPFFSLLFWLGELLLVTLSLYWLSNSLIAFVVVTLPGMYPIKALKIASDLVIGRRLRLLYRFLWLGLSLVCIWLIALIPAVLIGNLPILKTIPLVPLIILILTALSVVWGSSYMYLLYRKMVDDGSAPA